MRDAPHSDIARATEDIADSLTKIEKHLGRIVRILDAAMPLDVPLGVTSDIEPETGQP